MIQGPEQFPQGPRPDSPEWRIRHDTQRELQKFVGQTPLDNDGHQAMARLLDRVVSYRCELYREQGAMPDDEFDSTLNYIRHRYPGRSTLLIIVPKEVCEDLIGSDNRRGWAVRAHESLSEEPEAAGHAHRALRAFRRLIDTIQDDYGFGSLSNEERDKIIAENQRVVGDMYYFRGMRTIEEFREAGRQQVADEREGELKTAMTVFNFDLGSRPLEPHGLGKLFSAFQFLSRL